MLLFWFLFKLNPIYEVRFNRLSDSDKDKIITFLSSIDLLIIWSIEVYLIII
jgi:hypothetical protein